MNIVIPHSQKMSWQCTGCLRTWLCGSAAYLLCLGSWSPWLPALQAQVEEQLPIINVQKSAWKVLFQSFVMQPGSQAPSSEVGKITGMLAKALQKLNRHVLAEGEKDGLRNRAIQKELYKHYKEYNSLVDKRDRTALQNYSRFRQITAQSSAKKQIDEKARLIRRIQNLNRNLISVADSLPLEFTDRSTLPYESANIVLLKENYDFLIWSVVNGQRNVFQIEIRAYMANVKREVILWKSIVGQSNYDEVLEMIKSRTSSLLLGRPWAAMKIDVSTSNGSDAKIYLDGKLQGVNSLTSYGLHPQRPYELEIEATGLQGKHFFIELEAGKLSSYTFTLDQEFAEKYINVDASSPADVYMGVRYLGQTPLQLQVPGYETLLVLVAPDKRTINYDLSPMQEEDLSFSLEPSPELSLKEENDKLRTRFYWSSALFIISLAVPVLGMGIGLVNQGLYASNANNNSRTGYQQSMYIGFGVAVGGGILSGVLLGFNIWDFSRYTRSTRALSTTEFEPRKVTAAEAEVLPGPPPIE